LRYYATPSTPQIRELMRSGELGAIVTPGRAYRVEGAQWFIADNGCFAESSPRQRQGHGSPYGWPGEAGYLAWLRRVRAAMTGQCAFASAPDVLGDPVATLARAGPLLQPIRDLGFPVALVAQDGLENLTVPWGSFDVLFLGGSTGWKDGAGAAQLAAEAVRRAVPVHMGRVNTRTRLRYASAAGCSSVDGTMLAFGPDVNLPILRRWLAELDKPALW
jgi:hypothetical protein